MDDTNDADFGLSSGELHLVPVGNEWHSRFTAERRRIAAVLGTAAIDISISVARPYPASSRNQFSTLPSSLNSLKEGVHSSLS